ncbi:MAG: copper resistance protein NlpE [Flavobacteriaceae bacterium]|jgi:hypothetical protein|nr:copper resistance protein NlpE [Flavobacteriaceae bacterium]
MKNFLIAGCLFALVISCDKKQAQNSNSETDSILISDPLKQDFQDKVEITGTYKGDISCDDCESVELILKEDNSYDLVLHLLGEEKTENSIIRDKGRYTLSQDSTSLSLDKYELHFKIGKGKLYYLDNSSEINEHEVLIKE